MQRKRPRPAAAAVAARGPAGRGVACGRGMRRVKAWACRGPAPGVRIMAGETAGASAQAGAAPYTAALCVLTAAHAASKPSHPPARSPNAPAHPPTRHVHEGQAVHAALVLCQVVPHRQQLPPRQQLKGDSPQGEDVGCPRDAAGGRGGDELGGDVGQRGLRSGRWGEGRAGAGQGRGGAGWGDAGEGLGARSEAVPHWRRRDALHCNPALPPHQPTTAAAPCRQAPPG